MKNTNCGVYAIESPSGKRYIGSSINLRKRRNEHFAKLRREVHHCAGLQAAFKKYGETALQFTVLEYVPADALIAAEQRHIDAHAGRRYNACPVAESRLGRTQSELTRTKIRAHQTGRTKSAETRARMSDAQKGHAVSDATRKKIGDRTRGTTVAPEIAKKRADALKGVMHRDNRTGYLGVGPFRGKFRARWANKHLGLFSTAELAYAAVCAARDGLV